MKGIVIKNENGYFSVQTESGQVYLCKARGRLKKDKKDRYSLMVGDMVTIAVTNAQEGTIETIEPRRNHLRRPYVANIDQVILVVAAHDPDIHVGLLNKLLVMIEDADIPVVLCINKWDLHDADTESLVEIYRKVGYPVITASTWEHTGIEELRSCLSHKVSAIAGPSGVGKSSLLNALEPAFKFQTGTVSAKTGRGRHTTRHASLYSLDKDSFIMDTPGFSALDFSHITPTRLATLFPEFLRYETNCRFQPCSHTHEPNCAVKEALASGDIASSRYQSYVSLLEEWKG